MEVWPALPYVDWKDTKNTLHMYTQIVGKSALSHSPKINHWWNCGFKVTERGLTTGTLFEGPIPFEVLFNLAFDHDVTVVTGLESKLMRLGSSVADFLTTYRKLLNCAGVPLRIWPIPVEIPSPIPFKEDDRDSYDLAQVEAFHCTLLSTQRVLEQFRSQFVGKASPVLFWWGTFDICVTLFSGRAAPPREGADSILREAMSHEEMSFGWWPGDDATPDPYFYAYVYPEPPGMGEAQLPPGAFYSADKQEFFLPYDAVRTAPDPEALLLEFCEAVYAAGAKLADWDPGLRRS